MEPGPRDFLKASVMWTLWLWATEGKFFTLTEFAKHYRFNFDHLENITDDHLSKILDELERDNLMSSRFEQYKGKYYATNRALHDQAYKEVRTENTIFWRASTFGSDIFELALKEFQSLDSSSQNPQTEVQVGTQGNAIPFAGASLPMKSFRGVSVSKQQFFDLMVIALTRDNPDGTGEPPWDLKIVAEKEGLVFRDSWLDDFANAMESHTRDIVTHDIKSGKYPRSRICVYPNSAAFEVAPFLREKYYGYFSLDDFETNATGRGLSIPASDRLVALNHNAPETIETIETLRAVVDKARKSNEFAELFADPDEKVIVLSEMDAGIGLLSGPKVYIETIKSLLISKLEWIKEKLPDWSASALVSKGLDLLLKMLGLD